MILIPEIETIVLLVPRTGSGSIRRAIAQRYPRSILLYRHMEADGVPHGYDRWRKIGMLRRPLDRLWSLYKFCRRPPYESTYPKWAEKIKRSTECSFDEWLVSNETAFTNAYYDGEGFFPQFSVLHSMPETRKSQFVYLRPDLGTQIYAFERIDTYCSDLGIRPGRTNETEVSTPPMIGECAIRHLQAFFAWDEAEHVKLIKFWDAA